MALLLALDDNLDVLRLRSLVFTAIGYTVCTFEDPHKALERLNRGDIDIVLTDYEMPQMNGVAFAQQARSAGFDGGIVMSTGASYIEPTQALWIDHVVAKGSPATTLVAAVKRYTRGVSKCNEQPFRETSCNERDAEDRDSRRKMRRIANLPGVPAAGFSVVRGTAAFLSA